MVKALVKALLSIVESNSRRCVVTLQGSAKCVDDRYRFDCVERTLGHAEHATSNG